MRRSRPSSMLLSKDCLGPSGMSLETCSPIATGRSITRAASLTAALGCMRPKVAICATRSAPYLSREVADARLAPVLRDVRVDVGHRDAVGVEEALEQQVVLERVKVGDPRRVRHDRAGRRAAARADRDALLARPADPVPRDQEVRGVAHARDRGELEVEPVADVLRHVRAVALDQALLAQLAQVRVGGVTLGAVERRQQVLAQRRARRRSARRSARCWRTSRADSRAARTGPTSPPAS